MIRGVRAIAGFLIAACCSAVAVGCTGPETTTEKTDGKITVSFDFNTGDHGWMADFSDYSEESVLMRLVGGKV